MVSVLATIVTLLIVGVGVYSIVSSIYQTFFAPDKHISFMVIHSDGSSLEFPDIVSARDYAASPNIPVTSIRKDISYTVPIKSRRFLRKH